MAHPLRLSVRHIASSLVEEVDNKLGRDRDPSLVHIYIYTSATVSYSQIPIAIWNAEIVWL